MFLALKGQKPLPYEYLRATMCERFGWTLAYFDGLDVRDVYEILAVWDGMERAKKRTEKPAMVSDG